MQFIWAVIAVLLIWLAFITYFFLKLYSRYNNLIKGADNQTLSSALERIIKDMEIAKKDIDFLEMKCDKMEKDGLLHIQKIGLLRFNPFKDTGGDQSFILSLVDGQNTGVVISGLYSRSGTRWYAKKVVQGNSVDHELSTEEKKALQEASQIKK